MADPTKKKIVHVHLGKDDKFTTTLTAGRHELTADEHTDVPGGKDLGPDPYDYLLMALGSCTVMTVRMYADRKEWPVEDLYVKLRHNKRHADDCEDCDDPKSKIDHIEKELIVEGDLDDQQIERLLEISNRCPVYRTLQSDIKIESTIKKGLRN